MARHPRSRRVRLVKSRSQALAQVLECRRLLTTAALQQLSPILLHPSNPSQDTVSLFDYLNDPQSAAMVTSLGEIDIAFTPTMTPISVDNFASYAVSGEYNSTFFNRDVDLNDDANGSPSDPATIVQGGTFTADTSGANGQTQPVPVEITQSAAITDEASTSLQNVAGTIALAQTGAGPDTATSGFYFNAADNPALNYVPGVQAGFAVFGTVTAGESVVDAISRLNTDATLFSAYAQSDGLVSVPVTATPPTAADLVTINSITIPNDCTFTVTSAQPQIVTPVVNNTNGTLSFEYGSTAGTAVLTVTATSKSDSSTATETFEVTVPPAAGSAASMVSGPVVTAQTVTVTNSSPGVASSAFYLLSQTTDNTAGIGGASGNGGNNIDGLTVATFPTHGTLNGIFADGSLTYTPDVGFTGNDFFTYQVTDAKGVTSAPATVDIVVDAAPITVKIGFDAAPSLHFTQPDGTRGLIRVTSGNAYIELSGAQPTAATLKTGIYSNNVNIGDIDIVNEVGHPASLVIQGYPGKGQGKIEVGGISDASEIFDIVAHTTELTGYSQIAHLGNMELYLASNATIDLGGGVTALSIVKAVDTSVTGLASFRLIKTGGWTVDNPQSYYIEGGLVEDLVTHGNFDEGFELLDQYAGYTLSLAKIAGTLGGQFSEPWKINGNVHQISAPSVGANSWSLLSAGSLADTNGVAPTYTLKDVVDLSFGSAVDGIDVDAATIGTISIGGDLSDSTITADAGYAARSVDLKALNVKGAITNTTIYATGNVGTITAASLLGTAIAAGVLDSAVNSSSVSNDVVLTGALVDSASELTSPSRIVAVQLTAAKTSFSDSRISASALGTLRLGTIVTANGGVPIGLSAETIAMVRATLDTGGLLSLDHARLASAAALSAYLESAGLALGDFAIDLFPASA
jgi:cyclophilin family peptidyl-prolyl cis-trans isomerase